MKKVKIKKFKPRYSGKKSERFWQAVNQLEEPEHSEMYLAGVLLQDMEGKVISILNNYIKDLELK